MVQQRFQPPAKLFGRRPPPASRDYKAHDLGAKLTVGFEMLAARGGLFTPAAKVNGSSQVDRDAVPATTTADFTAACASGAEGAKFSNGSTASSSVVVGGAAAGGGDGGASTSINDGGGNGVELAESTLAPVTSSPSSTQSSLPAPLSATSTKPSGKRWDEFVANLSEKGYFRKNIEGSAEYTRPVHMTLLITNYSCFRSF
jgi:hypothetical protein